MTHYCDFCDDAKTQGREIHVATERGFRIAVICAACARRQTR